MQWAHLIFGILLFVVFAITGQYMRADFPDKDVMDPMLRVLTRSRHIYILFSAFLHILLGVYFRFSTRKWQHTFQFAGSALLFASSYILVRAWYTETYTYQTFSELSRWGIYLSLAGTALHLIGGVRGRFGRNA
ncbi:MAG TPA: hypothetical protein PKA82_01460 [Pyrinomonadaceae bacterium]|nr:hypothetical protein [Pyrinomonadaceae bacterium]